MALSSTLSPAAALPPQRIPARAAMPDPAPEPVQKPGSGVGSALRHGMLKVPRLVAGKTSPKFSLVLLLLSRAPAAGEDSIRPLLMSAYLGMELDHRLPSAHGQAGFNRPVFAR